MGSVKFGFLASVLATIVTTVKCFCYRTTLFATPHSSSKLVYSFPYDNCAISINPGSYSSTAYYLEISWSSSKFDVKGYMPYCDEDYVEVFLTRSNISIGRFCSNNAGKPFTMYSADGYARIVHRTHGDMTGWGFQFYYRLKSKALETLGGIPTNTLCYNTFKYARDTGVIYSTGWPIGYGKSSYSCEFSIYRSILYYGIHIVFMDISMYGNGIQSDCVQLFGSNQLFTKGTAVSPKFCTAAIPKKYTTYYSDLTVTFDRLNGPGFSSSYRGFVVGYIVFSKPPDSKLTTPAYKSSQQNSTLTNSTSDGQPNSQGTTPASTLSKQSSTVAGNTSALPNKYTKPGPGSESKDLSSAVDIVILGTLLPVVTIVIIIAFIYINKTRNLRIALRNQQNRIQPTMQAPAGSLANVEFSGNQHVHTVGTNQGRLQQAVQPYHAVHYDAAQNDSQQISFVANSLGSSRGPGTLVSTGGHPEGTYTSVGRWMDRAKNVHRHKGWVG